QPVRKPYLDFIVKVTWPKGKMLREYTVLLDPLGMMPAPSAQPAHSQAPAPTVPVPQPPGFPAPVPAPSAAPSPATASRSHVYGPVQRGDTLSHIASANAIDGVSYQQMLLALKAANPDAFFRDNVNALKAGAVLRIPTRAQALQVS